MPSLCPLCNTRKAKRGCPALERQICAVCCGTKRLTEIRCPAGCAYLAASRTHPPAVIQRRQERDLAFMLPFMAELTEEEQNLLLLFLEVMVRHAASALPSPNDADVAEAASAVASTLETARKGIIYQHQATSIPALRLAASFEDHVNRLTHEAGSAAASLERETANSLRQLSRAAGAASQAFGGEEPPVFLNLAKRLVTVLAQDAADAGSRTQADPSRLVIPG